MTAEKKRHEKPTEARTEGKPYTIIRKYEGIAADPKPRAEPIAEPRAIKSPSHQDEGASIIGNFAERGGQFPQYPPFKIYIFP
jgi:hypothetical protein